MAPSSGIDPVLFNSLVSALDKDLGGVFTMFAKLGRTGNNVDDRIRIEHNPERAKCGMWLNNRGAPQARAVSDSCPLLFFLPALLPHAHFHFFQFLFSHQLHKYRQMFSNSCVKT